MIPVAALLSATVLAAALCGCGAAEDPPARATGEEQALGRAEAMLAERPDTPPSPDTPPP